MSPLSLRALPRRARRRSVIAPLLIAAPAALAALPAAAHATSVTLDAVGCGGTAIPSAPANTWVVPDGVTEISVRLQGQPGATGGTPGTGGAGAFVEGTTSVTAGEVLYACVNIGGGAGGPVEAPATRGGDGGGYTSLSKLPDQSSALAVAGGGGGGGGIYGIGAGGPGGNAGTTGAGANGMNSTDWVAALPGRGAAGSGGAGGVNTFSATYSGEAGESRRGGAGGRGQNGGPSGGGGGAGAWGGGGGAGAHGYQGTGAGAYSAGAGGGGGDSVCYLLGCQTGTSRAAASVTIEYATPTTTTVALDTTRAISGAQVTYTAVVSPASAGGDVTFTVDGNDLWNCVDVPLVAGAAECRSNIPGGRGAHVVRAVYSGYDGAPERLAGSADEESFTVYGGVPSVSPGPTAEFGEVELGKSTTRPITVTNIGDADLAIDEVTGIYIGEYEPRARPPRSTEFTALDDQCRGRSLAPGTSCVVVVRFAPSALGERTATVDVESDSWEGTGPVDLVGTGIAARPEPQPQPEQREQERAPQTPAAPQPPAAPAATPSKPVEPARTPPAVGASSPISAARPASVTRAGGVRLPLVCPPGQPCAVSGTLTVAVTGGQARAAAKTTTRVLVRFSGVRIAAGKAKTLSLRLPASFVTRQQAMGVRKVRTTLTVHTTLGDGRRVTRRQAVTLLIPRARAAQRAAPGPAERPSFTG